MTVIRWEEPAAQENAKTAAWRETADELRAVPGSWAVVFEGNSTQTQGIVQGIKRASGVYAGFAPAGLFEACSRTIKPGITVAVYARYIGE